jgi:hypothetical protein
MRKFALSASFFESSGWLTTGPAVSHDILDLASRCSEPLAITREMGDSVRLSGRAASSRYASVMPGATTVDRPQRNVYDPRVRELIRATCSLSEHGGTARCSDGERRASRPGAAFRALQSRNGRRQANQSGNKQGDGVSGHARHHGNLAPRT